MSIQTDYLRSVFDPKRFQETVSRTLLLAKLMRDEYQYDTIAFTGTSGSALGYILGYSLKMPLICVRKDTPESSHYMVSDGPENKFEGYLGAKRYLIVDDFIASGATIDRIAETINAVLGSKVECAGILLYAQGHTDYAINNKDQKDRVKLKQNGQETLVPIYSSHDEWWHSVDDNRIDLWNPYLHPISHEKVRAHAF